MSAGSARISGTLIATLGGVIVAFLLLDAAAHPDPWYWAVESYPIFLSITLTLVGIQLARGRLVADRFVGRLLAWAGAGVFVLLFLGFWFVMLATQFQGRGLLDPPIGLITMTILGALIGLLVGTYDARAIVRKNRFERTSRVNETLRSATSELVEQGERSALERAVCERLTDSDAYEAAWIGRYDVTDRLLRPVTAAGLDEARLAAIEIPAGGDPTDTNVLQRAIETETVQFVQHGPDDGRAHWWDALDSIGVDSLAAVPIVGADGAAGLVCIYTDRENVLDKHQREVFAELGETVGHAIDAIRAHEALEQREQELVQHNDRLDEFAGVVSHDLRNPLNVATMRLDLLQQEQDDENLEHIDDALQRMEALIADLLTLARQGESVDDVGPVRLRDVATEAWATVSSPSATLQFEDADAEMIACDRSRLRQLLENLFRNSIEHGGEDVTITVGATTDGFYVEDDGPGIPAPRREDVFEAGHSTNAGGTGFGLNIVRNVADAHDWQVAIEDSPTGGARFEFSDVAFDTTSEPNTWGDSVRGRQADRTGGP